MDKKQLDEFITSMKALGEGVNALKDRLEVNHKAHDDRLTRIERSILDKGIAIIGAKTDELPKKKWSWARLCFAMATNNWRYAPFEKEECEKWQDQYDKMVVQQTMIAADLSLGGALIPPQYIAELIELLRPALITGALGVTMMDGLIGSPVTIPRQTGKSTAYWIAPEGTSITASDLATGKLDLQPHTCAALVKLSNNLTLLANPSVEAIVRRDIALTLAEEIDKQFFQGDGALGKPVGLKNQAPVIPDAGSFTATDAGTIANSIQNIIKAVEENEGLKGTLKFACTPASYWVVAKALDADKRIGIQPQAQASISTPLPTDWFGFPVLRSTLVDIITAATADSHNVYFGNWMDSILGMWSTLQIAASNTADTAFKNNELWVRAIAYVDYGVRNEKSFAKMKDVE